MATLLLADESVTIQRVIQLTFADQDVRVIAVGDGESAIARFDEDRPDIVLADVGISGVDGYKMIAHVKAASSQIPFLLLAGAFEPVDEGRARAAGCDGVLVKPFEPRQLVTTVRELLAGARPAGLWPTDMPRVDAQPAAAVPSPEPVPELAAVPAPEPVVVEPMAAEEPIAEPVPAEAAPIDDRPLEEPIHELVPALPPIPVFEQVELPVSAQPVALVSDPQDLPEPPMAQTAAKVATIVEAAAPPKPSPTRTASQAQMSLANVFSAMLAAERQNPDALRSMAASPALSESAVEEIVQKVLRKMTNEHVRKIVLETAERLIREEIARIKL